jgi:Zn-dependent peptidase ImmA (M78 family)
VAIEKGERAFSNADLVRLAGIYGIQVHALVREQYVEGEASPRFRVPSRSKIPQAVLSEAVDTLRRMGTKYAELERLHGIVRPPAPLEALRTYQDTGVPSGVQPALAGREAALTVRGLLGLGDEPAREIERRLESEAGFRIFHLKDMPAGLSAILLWSDELGACVAINPSHPLPRRRWSLAHEAGHFLRDREAGDVYEEEGGSPSKEASEVFADAFAAAFLIPENGVARRFAEMSRVNARFTPRDLLALASSFEVSFRAMAERLEELKLLPRGTYERIRVSGLRPSGIEPEGAIQVARERPPVLPLRYIELAVGAYAKELISEGSLAEYLETDRVSARELYERHSRLVLEDGISVELVASGDDLRG